MLSVSRGDADIHDGAFVTIWALFFFQFLCLSYVLTILSVSFVIKRKRDVIQYQQGQARKLTVN